MKRVLSILPQFRKTIICFISGDHFNIADVLNLLAIKQKASEYHTDIEIRSVQSEDEFRALCRGEIVSLMLLVENVFDKSTILCHAHIDDAETPVEFLEVLMLEDIFDDAEAEVLKRINDPEDKIHQYKLKQLWEIQEHKENLLTNALIADKLLRQYLHLYNFVRYVINHSHANLHSLYLTIVDYLVRNRHSLGKPKTKSLKEAYNVKGKVICIPKQGSPSFMDTLEGFALYPQAYYLINFWTDGRMQVHVNEDRDQAHKHLDHLYAIIMDGFKERLEKKIIPLSTIKWVSEEIDMVIFENTLGLHDTLFFGKRSDLQTIRENIEDFRKPWGELSADQAKQLDRVGISLWDLFNLNDMKTDTELRFNCIPFYGRENRPGRMNELFLTSKAKKLSDMIRKKLIKKLNG